MSFDIYLDIKLKQLTQQLHLKNYNVPWIQSYNPKLQLSLHVIERQQNIIEKH